MSRHRWLCALLVLFTSDQLPVNDYTWERINVKFSKLTSHCAALQVRDNFSVQLPVILLNIVVEDYKHTLMPSRGANVNVVKHRPTKTQTTNNSYQ